MKIYNPLSNFKFRRSDRTETKYIVVHCSATQPTAYIGAEDINKWHIQRGWWGIGYHYVIRREGTVESGEPEAHRGAHVRGHNTHSIGICMVGGIAANGDSEANYTPEQYGALAILLRNVSKKYPNARVLGHRDLSPDIDGDGEVEPHEWIKDCPCFDAGKFWKAVK